MQISIHWWTNQERVQQRVDSVTAPEFSHFCSSKGSHLFSTCFSHHNKFSQFCLQRRRRRQVQENYFSSSKQTEPEGNESVFLAVSNSNSTLFRQNFRGQSYSYSYYYYYFSPSSFSAIEGRQGKLILSAVPLCVCVCVFVTFANYRYA